MNLLQPALNLLIRSASREGTDKYVPGLIILKAAEKVDKHKALTALGNSDNNEAWYGMTEEYKQIYCLLESLPDKEPK